MTIDQTTIWGAAAFLLQFAITLGVILRVILTRHPPGAAFAWILLTAVVPYIGFILYLMFGERPIGKLRARRLRQATEYWRRLSRHKLTPLGPLPRQLVRHRTFIHLTAKLAGLPLTTGSKVELMPSAGVILSRMLQDIREAKTSVKMAFYIWSDGGIINDIQNALADAAKRGVRVRILLDDFGSRPFLHSAARQRLEKAGIEIASALPMKLLAVFGLQRADLRLHRKVVVIDDRIGYTGSFNMIAPERYDAAEDVGAWVDAMARIEGPAVLHLLFIWTFDWALQPDSDITDFEGDYEQALIPNQGDAAVLSVPSGPHQPGDASLLLVIDAINRAEHSLVVTTPYFVPNESVVNALLNASLRGVDVKLIVPRKVDSTTVGYAMRRYFDDLLQVGIKIYLYEGGLLHTKSIAVDDEFAVFGTLNIDNRSMHLNYELMLVIFDSGFTRSLDDLMIEYESKSRRLDAAAWRKRPLKNRIKEGASYLISPLL